MTLETDSLERLIPDAIGEGEVTGEEALKLHLARYDFAATHARPGRLLDIACGVGYGTRRLGDRADVEALGVDLSEEAIRYARQRYAAPRVQFAQGDALTFEDSDGFDTIVSLETIEHVGQPRALLANLTSLLRPGGVLIGSVPVTPSVDINPHHRHDFTARSFRAMLHDQGLEEVAALEQVQPVNPLKLAEGREKRLSGMRKKLLTYYALHPRALQRRLMATLRHGFCNKYLTLVVQRRSDGLGHGSV